LNNSNKKKLLMIFSTIKIKLLYIMLQRKTLLLS